MKSKKDEIVLAAVTLFAEKGYTETTIRDIANEVSLKTPSLYNYFPSKITILEHILNIYDVFLQTILLKLDNLKKKIEETDAKTSLMSILINFPEDENSIHPKILKIILQEQYRNQQIHLYMQNNMLYNFQSKFKDILDQMVVHNKIKPIDTMLHAKLLNFISISSAIEYYHHHTPNQYSLNTQFELTKIVIDAIVKKA